MDQPFQPPEELAEPTRIELDLLNRIDFFEPLSDEVKAKLVMCLSPKTLEAGQLLFREGAAAEALYVIKSGMLLVSTTDQTFGLTCELARFTAGQAVGEMALVSDTRRSASVRAVERTEVLVLSKGAFCLLYTSPSPRDLSTSRMPSSA